MSEKQYFVKRSGKIRGPFDTKKIKELVSTQNVLPSDEISTSEKGPWQAVRLVSGLNSKSEFSDNQDTSQSFMKSRYFTIAIGIASLVGTGLVGGLFEYLGGRLAQNAASTADPFQNPQPDVFTEWMNRHDFLKRRSILESDKDGIKFWDLGYWMEAVEGKAVGGENQFRCKYSDSKGSFDVAQWYWAFELADKRFTDMDATYRNQGLELYQHNVFKDKEGVAYHQAVWRKKSFTDLTQNMKPDVFTEWMNRYDFLKLRDIFEGEKDGIKFWDSGYWMEAVEGKFIGGENQFRCKYSEIKAGVDNVQWLWNFEVIDKRFTDMDATYRNQGFELYQHNVFKDKEGVTHHQAVWRKNSL